MQAVLIDCNPQDIMKVFLRQRQSANRCWALLGPPMGQASTVFAQICNFKVGAGLEDDLAANSGTTGDEYHLVIDFSAVYSKLGTGVSTGMLIPYRCLFSGAAQKWAGCA